MEMVSLIADGPYPIVRMAQDRLGSQLNRNRGFHYAIRKGYFPGALKCCRIMLN